MKKYFFIMALTMSSNLYAASAIQFDKGIVNIQFEAIEKPYKLTYEKKPNCQSEIVVKESGGTVKVYHTRGQCPEGATFTLTVNPSLIGVVQLDAGVVHVVNADYLLSEQINTKASVDAGIVKCDERIFRHRIVNYAGQEAIKNFNSEKNFEVHLDAGVLHL